MWAISSRSHVQAGSLLYVQVNDRKRGATIAIMQNWLFAQVVGATQVLTVVRQGTDTGHFSRHKDADSNKPELCTLS